MESICTSSVDEWIGTGVCVNSGILSILKREGSPAICVTQHEWNWRPLCLKVEVRLDVVTHACNPST